MTRGKTLGDIGGRGHTTGVEGTQRQLGTRLTDGLGGDDADGLADVDQLVGGQGPAVALGAHAALDSQVSTERALTSSTPWATRSLSTSMDRGVVALVQHGLSVGRVDDVGGEQTGVRATVGGLDEHQVAVVCIALGDADGQTGLGAAVLFAHDDILGDVDQTTGQVTGFCGTQCGIGQTPCVHRAGK